jgi:hypothetical protein
MAIKEGDWWKGSISINSANASGGSTNTDSFCYRFTLPGIFTPGKNLRRLWELVAITWNNLIKLSSNHLNVLGIMTHTLGCDEDK